MFSLNIKTFIRVEGRKDVNKNFSFFEVYKIAYFCADFTSGKSPWPGISKFTIQLPLWTEKKTAQYFLSLWDFASSCYFSCFTISALETTPSWFRENWLLEAMWVWILMCSSSFQVLLASHFFFKWNFSLNPIQMGFFRQLKSFSFDGDIFYCLSNPWSTVWKPATDRLSRMTL